MTRGAPGYLALLRRLERETPDRPRIGRSDHLRDEIADLGQDPQMAFPAGEFSDTPAPSDDAIRRDRLGRVPLRPQFLGLFGAFGALPLTTTEEAQRWQDQGQDGFVRFADIFAARFLQLFFRAWSDSHAISQHDRPDEDRFALYVAALTGIGTPAFLDHDAFPDMARLPLVSVFGGRVRSAIRLRQMLSQHFGVAVRVEEHVPLWLGFEAGEIAGLGQGGALGRSCYLGNRVQSVGERICIHLDLPDADRLRAFLPGGTDHHALTNLVFWYLGRTLDVDLALRLPPSQVPPAALGETVLVGWMGAVALPPDPEDRPVEVTRIRIDPESAAPREAA